MDWAWTPFQVVWLIAPAYGPAPGQWGAKAATTQNSSTQTADVCSRATQTEADCAHGPPQPESGQDSTKASSPSRKPSTESCSSEEGRTKRRERRENQVSEAAEEKQETQSKNNLNRKHEHAEEEGQSWRQVASHKRRTARPEPRKPARADATAEVASANTFSSLREEDEVGSSDGDDSEDSEAEATELPLLPPWPQEPAGPREALTETKKVLQAKTEELTEAKDELEAKLWKTVDRMIPESNAAAAEEELREAEEKAKETAKKKQARAHWRARDRQGRGGWSGWKQW